MWSTCDRCGEQIIDRYPYSYHLCRRCRWLQHEKEERILGALRRFPIPIYPIIRNDEMRGFNYSYEDDDNDDAEQEELMVAKNTMKAKSPSPNSSIFYEANDVCVSDDGRLAIKKDNKYFVLQDRKLVGVVSTKKSLIATVPVSTDQLSKGDVVIDPETNRAMFFISGEDSFIRLKDITTNTTVDRDIIDEDITGAISIPKLLSINHLFRGCRELVPLSQRYGVRQTAEVVAKQFISHGDIDPKRVEFELNPSMAAIETATAISNLTKYLTGLKLQ